MGTYAPKKLLQLWQREEILVDAVIGHILQNLVNLQKDFDHQKRILNSLQNKFPPAQKSSPKRP